MINIRPGYVSRNGAGAQRIQRAIFPRVPNYFFSGLIVLFLCSVAYGHREVRFVGEFGGKGEEGSKYGQETYIAFDREGGIYITDAKHQRVQKLDANGNFQFAIEADPERFVLRAPGDIAVGRDGAVYVMDWIIVHIDGTDDPKIFNYAPGVHRFAPDGAFVASYPLQDMTQRIQSLEAAAPGIDADGKYALIIPQGDTKRKPLLTVDARGNIYVFDEGDVYKLDANGQPTAIFRTSQPGSGQSGRTADIAVDREGNLYIVDESAHRILKYDANGRFLLAFGEYGDQEGQFISPYHLIALDDGTILVADRAKYKKDYISDLPRRQYDLFQFSGSPYRIFRTRVQRVQRFYADGAFAEKILIRFRREDENGAHLKLKAIDYDGNLYFLHDETLKFSKYAQISPFVLSALQTEVKLRFTRDLEDIEIDNLDDLDANLGVSADFDQRFRRSQVDARLRLTYDVNEDLRLGIANTLSYMRLTDTSFYRTRPFEDFRGTFNQDDESTQTFWEDQIQLDFTLIRNHNPYSFREASAFAYLNVIRNAFINDALDSTNFRVFDFKARISDWGAGMRYDLSKAFRLQFLVVHFFGFNEYSYIDETNILYATGFAESDFTQALLTIDGVF